MARKKINFVCSECGYESAGWLGKCPSCNSWNSFTEEYVEKNSSLNKDTGSIFDIKPIDLEDIKLEDQERFSTGMMEFDRVLGGGIVPGSLILLGGDPGVGKSTLILQICNSMDKNVEKIYVSGEESVQQIKIRVNRLFETGVKLQMVSETNFNSIRNYLENKKPGFVVIDSIQTMFNDELSSAPGSVSQVRDITNKLVVIAKKYDISIIIIGHVTKDGSIAGPRVLEHMVDTVLYFEGERHSSYRIIRAVKNRFGSTNEIGVFEMKDVGLAEITNPSVMLISERQSDVSGSVIAASIEGTRPMLIEIQALTCSTSFGMPRRTATGADYNRMILLIAVLEKKIGLNLVNYDIYVNVIGGLKVDEPACDLAIIGAIASSFKDKPIAIETVLMGEVGLTGEVRSVSHIDKRISEAIRIGFRKCVVPYNNMKSIKQMNFEDNVQIFPVNTVAEALDIIFKA